MFQRSLRRLRVWSDNVEFDLDEVMGRELFFRYWLLMPKNLAAHNRNKNGARIWRQAFISSHRSYDFAEEGLRRRPWVVELAQCLPATYCRPIPPSFRALEIRAAEMPPSFLAAGTLPKLPPDSSTAPAGGQPLASPNWRMYIVGRLGVFLLALNRGVRRPTKANCGGIT